jgi:hypothetical protein
VQAYPANFVRLAQPGPRNFPHAIIFLSEIWVSDFLTKFGEGYAGERASDFWGYRRLTSSKQKAPDTIKQTMRANEYQTNKSDCAASAPSSGRTRSSNVKTNEQSREQPKSITSAVQISCSE